MKRRPAYAPQTDLEVIRQEIGDIDQRVRIMEHTQSVTLQSDNYTAVSDPVAFEVLINAPGQHNEATVNDPVVYYHPGETDGVVETVSAGFKSVGSAAKAAEYAVGFGSISDSLSIPDGSNFLRRFGDPGPLNNIWDEVDISNTDVFTYNDPITHPYNGSLNYNGGPFILRKRGRYLLSTWMRFSTFQSFASLFDFDFYVENFYVSIELDLSNPRVDMRPSIWTSSVVPGGLNNMYTLDTSGIQADDPFITPGIVFRNKSGSSKTFGQSTSIVLAAIYLGQFTHDIVDTDYPL